MKVEYDKWTVEFNKKMQDPEFVKEYNKYFSNQLTKQLYDEVRATIKNKSEATRSMSGRAMQVIAKHISGFVGGSADLAASNKTAIEGSPYINKNDFSGHNVAFGIREHSMAGIANGLSLSGGFIPFVSTFLIFCDYMRPSIRMTALMGKQVIYVFTHDSIHVGEDGPTHQPVEQIPSLRLIPNLKLLRPCNNEETVEAWLNALENKQGPTALLLSRQNLGYIPTQNSNVSVAEGVKKGGYIYKKEAGKLKCVVCASGSEVELACKAMEALKADEWMRIVSVPSLDTLMMQDTAYIDSVIPENAKKVVIEACDTRCWNAILGKESLKLGITGFGLSAPGEVVARVKGLDVPQVAEKISKFMIDA
jgi:transketolase